MPFSEQPKFVAVTDSMQVNFSTRARRWKPPWSRQLVFHSH